MNGFDKIGEYMSNVLMKEKHVPGCEVVVYRDHKKLYGYRCGYSDYEMKKQIDGSELYFMYSCTKPITAAAGVRLIEDGKLNPDAPVADYIPEYANAYVTDGDEKINVGKKLTVRNLFTMTAGLNYNLNRPQVNDLLKKGSGFATTRNITASLVQDPLDFIPGDRFQYSLCHDVLAAVIEAAAEKRFSDYLADTIFTPLGMENASFHPSQDVRSRIAAQFASDSQGNVTAVQPTNIFDISSEYDSGGAGIICGVSDYIKFADTLACGGTSPEGYRFLKPESVKMLHTNQLDAHSGRTFGCAAGPGYGYGMGVRTRISTENTLTPLGEFGWDGAAGSYVMMDDTNKLSIFFAMQVLNWPSCIGIGHAPIREYAYKALSE